MNNKILLVIIFISIIIFYLLNNNNEKFTVVSNIVDIQIVVARYNESVDWINEEPFNKYPVICYNKGINNNYNIKKKHDIVKLPNKGRCDHTYLYHIINNYDDLHDITLFLPGSTDLHYKLHKAKALIQALEYHKRTVFIGNYYNNVKEDLYNFTIDNYKCQYSQNNLLHVEDGIDKSKIRPFGKWFESKFGNRKINVISYWGIIGISKEHIHHHPVSYYRDLINELDYSNPEVGHYIERSWAAIFYPINEAIFINQDDIN
jgi:hypothetical protein